MDRFQSTVLISFGTTFMPSIETQLMIADVIKKTPGIGYIWSLKPVEGKSAYHEVDAMKLPNLKLMKFVP